MKKAKMVKFLISIYGWEALKKEYIKHHLMGFWGLGKEQANIGSNNWKTWNFFELAMESCYTDEEWDKMIRDKYIPALKRGVEKYDKEHSCQTKL